MYIKEEENRAGEVHETRVRSGGYEMKALRREIERKKMEPEKVCWL